MKQRLDTLVLRRMLRHVPVRPMLSRLLAPVASFTFDDFPKSALATGGTLLEQAGARGTYYVTRSLQGKTLDGSRKFDPEDVIAAHERGHEIGCHGFVHERFSRLSRGELRESTERNREYIQGLLGDYEMTSFAYPYGDVSFTARRELSHRFAVCRGTRPGINQGRLELSDLKAVCLEPAILRSHSLERMIEQTATQPGWLIFVTHDVADNPSPWGCTPRMLEHLIDQVRAAGIEILPVRLALAHTAAGADGTTARSETPFSPR